MAAWMKHAMVDSYKFGSCQKHWRAQYQKSDSIIFPLLQGLGMASTYKDYFEDPDPCYTCSNPSIGMSNDPWRTFKKPRFL